MEKSGKVKLPRQYRNWEVEICGDSDNTGGFYLIIFHNKEQLLYWDTTEAGILQQIINDGFEIGWYA